MSNSHTTNKIDADGYRRNVGIVVCNANRQVLWARRIRHDGWQFPQGGIENQESPEQAAYRELYEEVGLTEENVKLLGATNDWHCYDVPYTRPPLMHRRRRVTFRGQKQRWFLFRLTAADSLVNLDKSTTPEFDAWRWVDYWQPIDDIIEFKRSVYQKALAELEPYLSRDA